MEIQGYKISRLDREKKIGGGVCIYTRVSLKTMVLKDLTSTTSGFQQLWLQVQHKNLKSFLVCAAYRPPDCSVEYFEGEFTNTYTKALTLGIEIFVLGDLNCDLMKSCREGNTLKDLCETLNLTQLVTTPTRVTPQSSSLIDVILATNTSIVKETRMVEYHISDHYLTYIVLNLKIPKPPPTYIITRGFRKYDASKFLQDLERLPWMENSLIGDVSERVDHFNQHFLCLVNKHAPVKKVKIKHRQFPFVDEQLKQHLSERDQLLKIAKDTNSPQEWQTYRAKRNEVKVRLREAERGHVQSQLASCQKNSSKWKVIRNCIPRKESTQTVYSRDVKVIADEFNEFFFHCGI